MNDVFIMSKGHAASVQYPFLVDAGIITEEEWASWPSDESPLRIFANREIPGIDVTGGSLGHGLGIAAGIALAQKNDDIGDRKIFVVISEGELYEGSIWEALLFIAHHKFHEIKIILDVNNNIILGDPAECLDLGDIGAKFKAFGFNPKKIDGHDYGQITEGLDFILNSTESDLRILIANTVKGKGVSFMEGRPESHYWSDLDDEKLQTLMKELNQ
jgi:transketolase